MNQIKLSSKIGGEIHLILEVAEQKENIIHKLAIKTVSGKIDVHFLDSFNKCMETDEEIIFSFYCFLCDAFNGSIPFEAFVEINYLEENLKLAKTNYNQCVKAYKQYEQVFDCNVEELKEEIFQLCNNERLFHCLKGSN